MKSKWIALVILCLGSLMIVLDTTIVNVALPSIRASLGFTEASLAWVVNAYLLTFGGFLLLGGRLGDIYGPRRLFLIGLVVFTVASLVCGLSTSQFALVAARAVQGIGGAIVSAISLSLLLDLFTEDSERAKAMGVFGFVSAGGGSIGAMLGGILTSTLNWHWIFFINIPIGILVFIFSLMLLPVIENPEEKGHLDIWGAVTITASLITAVYAIVNGNGAGWLSMQTLGLLAVAIALLTVFISIELRITKPLMPLDLFRHRNITVANSIGVLWAAAMFAWFFLSALYMQLILGYSPFFVGLAFIPANLIMALFSLGLSAKIVMKFGIRRPLASGLTLAALGLVLFSISPITGSYWIHVFPAMVLLGIGAGIAFNPLLLAAMNDVPQDESGLASGIVNTSFMMGGALGLAILASIAAARTGMLVASGADHIASLNAGYHMAFIAGALFSAIGAILAGTAIRASSSNVSEVPSHTI